MPSRFTANFSFVDKARAVSVVGLYFPQSDVADFVTDPTANPITDVKTAIDAVSLGFNTQISAGREELFAPLVVPTDDQAYNSSKLIVYMQDTVTADKYTVTLPARDTTAYNTYPNSKEVILTIAAGGTAAIEALVTQLTTKAVTKNGNPFVITSIQIAGRKQG